MVTTNILTSIFFLNLGCNTDHCDGGERGGNGSSTVVMIIMMTGIEVATVMLVPAVLDSVVMVGHTLAQPPNNLSDSYIPVFKMMAINHKE